MSDFSTNSELYVEIIFSDKYFLFAAAIDAQRTATIRPKASKRRGGLFKNGGKAKYRGQTARRRAEKLALAESSTLKPLDSISVNQDKVEAVKKVMKNLFEDKPKTEEEKPVQTPEEIESIQEDSVEEVTNSESEAIKVPPEVQLKQAIEESSNEDYVYEEEPEPKDYSSEYMVNDAIEYPTLIDEEPEEIDEQLEDETTDDLEEEVAGALNISYAYFMIYRL